MFEKKFLKVVEPGFENYTGPLSVYEFENGVSLEAIPAHDRDRIAATMKCVEIAENGKENTAGISERLVQESKARAPVREVFERQSVEEKIEEERSAAEKSFEDTKEIYTEEQLDAIIENGGIKALREIAEAWGVKNRSIPTLRQMILDEQAAYYASEGTRIEKAKAAVEAVVRQTSEANGEPSEEKTIQQEVEDDDILVAAATGDMAQAINADVEQTSAGEGEDA